MVKTMIVLCITKILYMKMSMKMIIAIIINVISKQ